VNPRQPQRVLHVIPSISPRRGGPSQAVLAMVAAQRAQGLAAAIVTTNDDGPSLLQDLAPGRWQWVQGVPVLVWGRWSPPLRVLREFAIAPGLLAWLATHASRYDLLHIHALFSFPSTAAMALARRQQLPYIVRTIGQLQHWSLRQSRGRKRLLLHLIERRNLAAAAALHFTSRAEQQEAAALGLPAPSFVLPLGVDPAPISQPQPGAPGRPVQLLFLSRLHPKKQLPLLLEALALLRRRCPDAPWHLQIAGAGESTYEVLLRQQAQRLGLDKQLQWHGFVVGEAKRSLLRQADWFVLPSAAENFGIAAAEALAFGVPVLLSPGVALAQQVAQAGAGHCIDPTLPGLVAALMQAVQQPPPESMRQAARDLAAEQFSWSANTTRLLQRYQAAVLGSGR
jgi:glycosyltransferase involved in cell wall biosynthesis